MYIHIYIPRFFVLIFQVSIVQSPCFDVFLGPRHLGTFVGDLTLWGFRITAPANNPDHEVQDREILGI